MRASSSSSCLWICLAAGLLACACSPATGGRDGGGGGDDDAGPAQGDDDGGTGGDGDAGAGAADGGANGGEPDAGPPEDGGIPCTPAGEPPNGVVFAEAFANLYHVHELGPVPGVPSPLGGVVVLRDDPSTLWIAGESERATGGLYKIGVRRDNCGHIHSYVGTAERVVDVPYIDANLIETDVGTILYTGWPTFLFGAIDPAAGTVPFTLDLQTLGFANSSPGGLGRVPDALSGDPGGLRLLGWPDGAWHHLEYEPDGDPDGGIVQVTTTGVVLPNGPGGVAYVPAGSIGFPEPSVMVAEWSEDQVAAYQVDENGDPMPETRRDFFTSFPRPWGAYFEPETGDYLFLTWGQSGVEDSLFRVEGFEKPIQ